MGFFKSRQIKGSDLSTGDHVYTWRKGCTYAHHGIYVGNGEIVHFLTGNDSKLSWGSSSGSRGPGHVAKCSVSEFLDGKGLLRRFEYGVSRMAFTVEFRGGTCTTAKSNPPETVVHRAMCLLRKGFGKYNLFRHNCEDFALFCKTGLLVKGEGVSGQVAFASTTTVCSLLTATGIAPLLVSSFFLPHTVFTSVFVVLMLCGGRLSKDLGVRKDVVQVEVEDLISFYGHDSFEDVGREHTHTKKHKKDKWVVPKSQQIQGKFPVVTQNLSQQYGDDAFDPDTVFYEVVGGHDNKALYDLGSLARVIPRGLASQGTSHQLQRTETDELKKELAEMEAAMQHMAQRQSTIEEETERWHGGRRDRPQSPDGDGHGGGAEV